MTGMYTKHKPIRNKIKKYDPMSIVKTGIKILHEQIDSIENNKDWMTKTNTYYPWHILLLIRWTFQYTESKPNLKEITVIEFNKLYNAIYDLYDRVVLEDQPRERVLDTSMRRMLFYQLPFQVRKKEIKSSFGRQLILFQDMGESHNLEGESHNLDDMFKSITGISLTDYYNLYFCCWATTEGGQGFKLSIQFLQNQFPVEIIQKFFSVLSLDLDGAKKFIRNYTKDVNIRKWIDYQLNEHTPLERYPFLQLGDNFVPYSARLLDNSFMYNAYDIFKENNSNFLRDSFGRIFENYVAKGVEYACNDYLRESKIKSFLPKGSKTVDFLIRDFQASVLIDAKSTELHPIARILQTKDNMVKNLESTIISGVVQIIVTAHHLRKSGNINVNDTIFGMIVTFKDYLIGDGKRFWDDIISESVEKKLDKLGIQNPISPENLFYLSIEEFDYLVAGAKTKSLPISEILASAVERNRSPETKRLMFKQHLEDLWEEYFCPEYVTDKYEGYINTIIEKFS